MLSVFQAWVVECQWLHTHYILLGCRDFSHTVPAKEETEAGEEEAPAAEHVARSWNPGRAWLSLLSRTLWEAMAGTQAWLPLLWNCDFFCPSLGG